jgi:hypothetical protein
VEFIMTACSIVLKGAVSVDNMENLGDVGGSLKLSFSVQPSRCRAFPPILHIYAASISLYFSSYISFSSSSPSLVSLFTAELGVA